MVMKRNLMRSDFWAILFLIVTAAAASATTAQYTYDTLNRLTQVQYDDGTIIQYAYDLAGNRISRQVQASTPTSGDPVADPGSNQTVLISGSTVYLNGSGSYDPLGLALTYLWTIVSAPPGSHAALIDPTSATPTFVADVYGDYVIQLIVRDSQGVSQAMTMTVSLRDVPPVADAGPNQVFCRIGTVVTLDGTKSHDANGQAITSYQWTLTAKPTGSTAALSDPASPTPTFVTDTRGLYTAQLVVSDNGSNSNPAIVKIRLINPLTPVHYLLLLD